MSRTSKIRLNDSRVQGKRGARGEQGSGEGGLDPSPRCLQEAENLGAGPVPEQHQEQEALPGAENFSLTTRTRAEQAEAVPSSLLFQDIIDFLPLL